MTDAEIRKAFIEELTKVAPDIDPSDVGPDDHLQDDLEIDSMDFLNLVEALHKRLGVNVPETDYPQIATLNLAAKYLAARLG
ncbi:acyl carrier protein [Ostreiculturibacter nitratireducens]|uniref:acyl carrier protein n=1 Tax=Ostreiculturibacter nitratireducens TaxID=3075226 RepID=UPI0031B6255F